MVGAVQKALKLNRLVYLIVYRAGKVVVMQGGAWRHIPEYGVITHKRVSQTTPYRLPNKVAIIPL